MQQRGDREFSQAMSLSVNGFCSTNFGASSHGIQCGTQAPHRHGNGRFRRLTVAFDEFFLQRRSVTAAGHKLQMSLVTHQEQAAPILSGPSESRDFPDWFRDQQRAAWQQFETLPNPTRKDQPWRFSNVGLLDLAPFKISPPLSEDDRNNVLKYSRGLDEYAGRMIFANDQLIERDVVSEDLKRARRHFPTA